MLSVKVINREKSTGTGSYSYSVFNPLESQLENEVIGSSGCNMNMW